MITLNMVVEGQTERAFARSVITPHLLECGIFVGSIELVSNESHGQHGGGARVYEPIRRDICQRLKTDQRSVVHCTTMIDLFRLPEDFPGYRESSNIVDCYERVARLEAAFEEDICDRRFKAHLQLHEFEAILFSNPRSIAEWYTEGESVADALQATLDRFGGNPEKIDREKAPSQYICQAISEHGTVARSSRRRRQKEPRIGKVAAGRGITEMITLSVIRRHCSHFNAWLTRLESLGKKHEEC